VIRGRQGTPWACTGWKIGVVVVGGLAAWFWVELLRAAEQCVRRLGIEPADLLRTPAADSAAARSYCPRCHGQFVLEAGECSECEGVRLKPLEPEDPQEDGRGPQVLPR